MAVCAEWDGGKQKPVCWGRPARDRAGDSSGRCVGEERCPAGLPRSIGKRVSRLSVARNFLGPQGLIFP